MFQKQFGGTNNASCYPQLFKISLSKQNYDRKSTCLIQCDRKGPELLNIFQIIIHKTV